MIKCPLCEYPETIALIESQDKNLAGEAFEYRFCVECETVFQDPMPSSQVLQDYYCNAYTASSETRDGNRLEELTRRVDFLAARCPDAKFVFEAGAANGLFLHLYRQKTGFNVCGWEPSENDRKAAIGKGLLVSDFHWIEEDDYWNECQLYVAMHVLEHIAQPGQFLSEINFRTQAYVYLEVPSTHYNWQSATWNPRNVNPTHLCHFSQKGLVAAIENQGLEILEVRHELDGMPSLCILARKPRQDAAMCFLKDMARLEADIDYAVLALNTELHYCNEKNLNVMFWGYGTDAQRILRKNLLSPHWVVDSNPSKQGEKVVSPHPLNVLAPQEAKPQAVIHRIVIGALHPLLIADIEKDARAMFPDAEIVKLI